VEAREDDDAEGNPKGVAGGVEVGRVGNPSYVAGGAPVGWE